MAHWAAGVDDVLRDSGNGAMSGMCAVLGVSGVVNGGAVYRSVSSISDTTLDCTCPICLQNIRKLSYNTNRSIGGWLGAKRIRRNDVPEWSDVEWNHIRRMGDI